MKTNRQKMDRRMFIKTAALGSASMALSVRGAGKADAAESEKSAASPKMPTRILGKTGVSLPILGLGGIDWTTNQSLLRMAFKMGVTHWDAASNYENGKCELGLGQYFAKYPEDRKSIFLVTKASHATDPKELTELLAQSLERMQTDCIDLYFIHMLQDPKLLTPEVKAWAEQAKKAGKIKFFGFSTHANVGPMMTAAASLGWIDALMTTYNFQNMTTDDVKKGMDAIDKAGVGFIAMKTQGQRFGGGPPAGMPQGQPGPPAGGQEQEGAFAGSPPQRGSQGTPQASSESEDLSAMQHFMDKGYTLEQAKMKAVWEDARVAVALSKIGNLTILKDNIAAAGDSKPLSALDREVLSRLAANTCTHYCQGCMRCESAMVSAGRIPDVLRYMMYYNGYGERDQAKQLFRELPAGVRGALAANDYSAAERVCPNHIKIGAAMKEAVRLLG